MSDYIIFDGIDSREYGMAIFDFQTDSAPARVYERYEIAGRDGDLIIDRGRYKNVQAIYWGIIYENCDENMQNFRAALRSKIGYCRLEDSFHHEEYYDACFTEALEISVSQNRDMCKFQLIFDRKPQRWLSSGEDVNVLTTTGTIYNPTQFSSNPLLRIYGTGKMYIGSYGITVSQADVYTDIDCFLQEAYKGIISKNDKVTFHDNGRPELKAGTNNIQLPNTITKLEITPRWYTI